jgi:outer membrane receptor for ferrienterochelin and colicin
MHRLLKYGSYLVVALALSILTPSGSQAQGITSAAVQGMVTREGGSPVEAANVTLTNTATGNRLQTTTRSNGRFNFENAVPGGPYTILVRAIGFEAATRTGIQLSLGQRYVADFELKAQIVTLQELTVIASTNPLINTGRTGAAQFVTDTTIQRLPLLGRNFTDLLRTSPQVTSGSSIAGQNNRFNAILIDGGVNNDVFGISSAGTPGAGAGAKPLSVEALQEFQILAAPFDIRQGSFSGGLVNAITKSGTNQFRGSLFSYFQRPEIVGLDTAGIRIGQFDIKQYGATFGGPIIKDKLHFFASADVQASTTPFFGLEASEPATGISVATASRIADIIRTKYGFDAGGLEAPQNLSRPDKNFLGKLNYQMGDNSQFELSYNYVRASQDAFNRTSRNLADRDGWQLSNSGHKIGNTTNTVRGKYTSLIGRANLEVLLGYQRVRDAREIANQVPLIMVQGDLAGNYLAGGGERFSHGNELDQDVYEATANLTFDLGSNHQITVGTHNEFFSFRNLFANNRFGTWTFGNADSLEANLPRRYEVLLEARPGGFTADFGVKQFGGYIQDAWRPTDRLTVTGGLRFDVPFSDSPFQNPLKALTDTLGVNTAEFPSGNVLFSPRLGFNWDLAGTGNTIIRGGVGLFSGRPPYVWMSNAFTNTGLEQLTLICGRPDNGNTPPPLTTDVSNLPRACVGGAEPAPPTATVNYFEEDFKFQQALKYAFGIDHRFAGDLVATLDVIHTRNRNQLYQVDDNVVAGEVNAEGRRLYGTPNAAGTALVRSTKVNGVRQVIHHLNKNADQSTFVTVQLQKAFADKFSFSAGYTYSTSKDLQTLYSSIASSNLRNSAVDGSLEDRNLRNSGFDVPHKISLSGTANLPFGTQLSLVYTARAGLPYSWTISNDANADGIAQNDLMYVPASADDISLANAADWDRLNLFIASQECLRESRGKLLDRNTCRQPWQKFLDMRVAKAIAPVGGQSLLITADVFNFLNLINRDWGVNRETPLVNPEFATLLTMSGYDNRGTATQSDDRGRYTVPAVLPSVDRVLVGSSRWRIQLGAKYLF